MLLTEINWRLFNISFRAGISYQFFFNANTENNSAKHFFVHRTIIVSTMIFFKGGTFLHQAYQKYSDSFEIFVLCAQTV